MGHAAGGGGYNPGYLCLLVVSVLSLLPSFFLDLSLSRSLGFLSKFGRLCIVQPISVTFPNKRPGHSSTEWRFELDS